MLGKSVGVLILLAMLLGTASCAPSGESEFRMEAVSFASDGEDEVAQPAGEDMTYLTDPLEETTSIQNPAAEQVPAAATTQLPGSAPSSTEPGEAPGGAGTIDKDTEVGGAEPDRPETVDLATWLTYTNDVYQFQISYPPYFVVKELDDNELAGLTPAPLAAVYFQDQQIAQSDVAALAPPAFSVRIIENEGRQSIEDWLMRMALHNSEAGWFTEPYSGSHVSGVSVHSQNYMAPGWFVYVANDIYVYQLTPLGEEAELMLDTFAFTK